MRIERRYTNEGPVALCGDPVPAGGQRDPQPGRLDRLPAGRHRGAGRVEPGRDRRPRAEILPQGRRPGAPEEGRGERRPLLPVALRGRREGAGEASRGRALRLRAFGEAGLRPACRLLGLLGLEGRLFLDRGGRLGLLRRAALHAGAPDVRAELAAMVQHRPALGLRHRWAGAGPLLRRPPDRRADAIGLLLRAPAAACLLHPGRARRPRQRGRHHGSVGARGAPVQVRLRHRLEFLGAARRGRAALRRRALLRADVVPQDRRPGGRRDQVRRHDAARRQDGRRRRRPPRHRDLHRLEGARGAEGRGARDRLEDLPEAPEGRHEGLRQLRGRGRRLLRAGEEPGAEARDQARPPRPGAGQLYQARHPVRAPGLQGARLRHLRHRLGFGGLSHRLGAELEQLGVAHRRLPRRRRGGRRLAADGAHHRQAGEDAESPRAVGEDRLCRLGLGRSGAALQHHHERLAHLPGGRAHPGLEPVLGVHVPRRHGLQPRLGEPPRALRQGRRSASTSRVTSTSCGCGPWSSRSRS